MLSWHLITIGFFIVPFLTISSAPAAASIINTVLGLPSECVFQNVVRPCQLSFSCWMEGGRHVRGCGENRWLFSCCVPDAVFKEYIPAKVNVNAIQPYSKKQFLRRRADHEMSPSPINLNVNNNNFQPECGIPRTSENTIQKRIIGGRVSQFGEFPWQAHIRIAEYQCGGVLVSRYYVATAAHCIQQARLKDIVVYLGELDTQNSGKILELYPSEKHRVAQKLVHPRFRFRMTQPDRYDLALLRLTRPAGYKAHILPICLPTYAIDLIGKKGVIAGWGKTEANMGHTGTNILRTASVPIIKASECIKWHESKQIQVELYGEMFCAGHDDGHQDACLGDSGGPLIVFDKGRYTLIGITSAGFGCGVDHQPGIYHNVQKTVKWIQSII